MLSSALLDTDVFELFEDSSCRLYARKACGVDAAPAVHLSPSGVRTALEIGLPPGKFGLSQTPLWEHHLTGVAGCTSTWGDRVKTALSLRNRFVQSQSSGTSDPCPFVDAELLDESSILWDVVQTNVKILQARWPPPSVLQIAEQFWSDEPEPSIHVSTVDGQRIEVRLLIRTLEITVRYPVLVHDQQRRISKVIAEHRALPVTRKGGKYSYLWITQQYSVKNLPSWLEYPAWLACTMANVNSPTPSLARQAIENSQMYVSTSIPQQSTDITAPSATANALFHPTEAPTKRIYLMCTKNTLFRVHMKEDIVEARMIEDGTTIQLMESAQFARVVFDGELDDNMFLVSDFPSLISHPRTSERYPLRRIIEDCLRLYQRSTDALLPSTDLPGKSGIAAIPIPPRKIISRIVDVPSLGSFIAYSDRTLTGDFVDGQRVSISPCWTKATVYPCDPEGSFVVRVANPIGVEEHVDALMRFAEWAFGETPQRQREHQKIGEACSEQGRELLMRAFTRSQMFLLSVG
ncbi:hypothetical protein BJ742DRAFT_896124 [Cladochytrium replicatum]|nr:hypothetical protein BJ742DRAFT_896124 [Cladochytrium replicatum]